MWRLDCDSSPLSIASPAQPRRSGEAIALDITLCIDSPQGHQAVATKPPGLGQLIPTTARSNGFQAPRSCSCHMEATLQGSRRSVESPREEVPTVEGACHQIMFKRFSNSFDRPLWREGQRSADSGEPGLAGIIRRQQPFKSSRLTTTFEYTHTDCLNQLRCRTATAACRQIALKEAEIGL
jgi:hypothetical protein